MRHNTISVRKFSRLFIALVLTASVLVFAQGARAQVQMDGQVWFSMVGSRLTVFIEELENLSDSTTDRLRMKVWASEDHWSASDQGYFLGAATLPRIAAHGDRDNQRRSMKLHRPDTDWYYVTVVIEERVVDESGQARWEIRDWRESDNRVLITSKRVPLFPWE